MRQAVIYVGRRSIHSCPPESLRGNAARGARRGFDVLVYGCRAAGASLSNFMTFIHLCTVVLLLETDAGAACSGSRNAVRLTCACFGTVEIFT